MKKTTLLSTISLITVALLTGCGSSSSETTPETTNNNKLTGYFIDAKVSGVAYKTSSGETGTTDEFGRFNYKNGDKVQLKLGNLILGEVVPTSAGLITPETLSEGNVDLKTLLLRLLQAADSDNNTSNGITISADLLSSISEVSISDYNETTLLTLDSTFKDTIDENHDNIIDVDETEATTHFEESTRTWDEGKRPDDNESNENTQGSGEEGKGSNIGYLKNNHTNYSQHGSTSLLPKATKDATDKSINWAITATSEEGATKLADHITFMIAKLKEGKNPRGWDKLFLMEAYMKFNQYYTTNVEQTNTDVVISKKATTTCAYDVISAHSDSVSGDFFGKGDIKVDYSSIAEGILASTSCNQERAMIEAYILEKQETKPDETSNTGNGHGNGNGNRNQN